MPSPSDEQMPITIPIPLDVQEAQAQALEETRPNFSTPSARVALRSSRTAVLTPFVSADATHRIFDFDEQSLQSDDHESTPMRSPVPTRMVRFPSTFDQAGVNEFSRFVERHTTDETAFSLDSSEIPLYVSAAIEAMARAVDWVIVPESIDVTALRFSHFVPQAKICVLYTGPRTLDLVHRHGLGGVCCTTREALADCAARIPKFARVCDPSVLREKAIQRRGLVGPGQVQASRLCLECDPNRAGGDCTHGENASYAAHAGKRARKTIIGSSALPVRAPRAQVGAGLSRHQGKRRGRQPARKHCAEDVASDQQSGLLPNICGVPVM